MQQEKQERRSSSAPKGYVSTYQNDFTGEFGRPSGSARYVSRYFGSTRHGCPVSFWQ